ncbi:MAG: VanZ family protein [Verrucomicrobiota bacterium]
MTPEPAQSRANAIVRWSWACALVVMIFVASGQSQVAAPNIVDIDKVAHFSVFGLLATLVARALDNRHPHTRRRWWAILIVSAYGACDELRQSLTPGRLVEFDDWVADTLGAITAVSVYQCWPAYRALLERRLFVRRPAVSAPESGPVNASAESCSP